MSDVVNDVANITPRILALPDDILVRIIHNLSPKDIIVLGCVCKRFVGPASEERLVWGRVCRAIVGPDAATSSGAWGAPSFQRLYSRLLRPYGDLLTRPWRGEADPLGSLLLAFPSPPYIIGGIVISLRLAEPGVTVVPVWRVSYDPATGLAAASCLRGGNSFSSMLRRLRREPLLNFFAADEAEEHEEEGEEEEAQPHPATLELAYQTGAPGSEVGGGNDENSDGAGSEAQPAGDDSGVAQAAVGEGGVGDGAAAAATSANASPTTARRRWRAAPYCCGLGGLRLTGFRFLCSGGCRQQEVEAVCRWAPAGAMPLLAPAPAPRGATATPTPTTAGVAAAQGAGGAAAATPSGSAASTSGIGASGSGSVVVDGDGDACVDLDVAAVHRVHERVRRVALTLHVLAVRDMAGPVSFSPLDAQSAEAATSTGAAAGAGPAPAASASAAAAPAPAGLDAGPEAAPTVAADTPEADTSGSGPAPGAVVATGAAVAPPLVPVPRPLVALPATAAAHSGLAGLWRGTYGPHGIEFLQLRAVGPQLLEARKLTGDDNVPAGQASFRIFLDRPGAQFAAQRGRPFQLPPEYVSRAGIPAGTLGGVASGASGGGGSGGAAAPRVLASFAARGQVAGSGHEDPQWIDTEAVVLGGNTFGMLWYEMRSFSAFRRVQLPPLPSSGEGCFPCRA